MARTVEGPPPAGATAPNCRGLNRRSGDAREIVGGIFGGCRVGEATRFRGDGVCGHGQQYYKYDCEGAGILADSVGGGEFRPSLAQTSLIG
jgi:hypothetical protein